MATAGRGVDNYSNYSSNQKVVNVFYARADPLLVYLGATTGCVVAIKKPKLTVYELRRSPGSFIHFDQGLLSLF